MSIQSRLNPAFPRHLALWHAISPSVPVGDLSHDVHHLVRVYLWSLRLAAEAGADPDLAGAGALVHDLVSIPKEAADRPLAGEQSAKMAVEPLRAAGYSDDEVSAIFEAVRTSSWSRGLEPTGPLGQVLQDADRLAAIGAVGIARTFACAQTMVSRGRQLRLFDDEDATAGDRAPDEDRFALDHFRTKLLKLARGMHLPTARKEATRRHAVMFRFLEELEAEVRRTIEQ